MGCPGTEHVDPRVKRTRALLQDAMRALVHEKSFGAISVQDVTERATVNRATFYAHYPDKQALMIAVLQEDFREAVGKRFDGCPVFTRESFREIVVAVVEFLGRKCDGCPAGVKELENVFSAAIQEELYNLFRHLQEGGRPAAFEGHSPDMVATLLSWSVYGAAFRWSHGKRKRSPEEIADSVTALLIPSSERVPVAA